METVKVSNEVFEALESTKKWDVEGYNGITFKKGLIRLKLDEGFQGNRQCLNLMDFKEFMDCLFNGYELEMTKEEKLINNFKSSDEDVVHLGSYRCGIFDTLKILGIEIKGINA